MRVVEVEGEQVLEIEKDGATYRVSATCPHYGAPLIDGLLTGYELRCPWHHACFDIRTGEALRAPALLPLKTYHDAPSAPQPAIATNVRSVAIVGAGAAGNAAAEMLRRRGFAGTITMFGTEEPVDRPNLSKDYLAGHAPAEWLPLPGASDVELVLQRVTKLDPATKTLTLADGSTRAFDAILLATGADPIRLPIPGADRPHVHYLRTRADAERIIAEAQSGRNAVVMGASFIGLEVAASLRGREVNVTVVAPEAVPLARILGEEAGDFVRRLHEEHGVVFRLGMTAKSIEDGRVVLADGSELPADFVVIGAGVRPNVGLAHDAGLEVDNGIVVDEFLRTSAEGIYAAGDVARVRGRRVEHWVVAERHGQVAAENILGRAMPYTDAPFFWSAHYDVVLAYVGNAPQWDEIRTDGSLDARDAKLEYVKDGKVAAVVTLFRDRESLEAEVAMEVGGQASSPVA
jgi:apoptosis-inducing factor 3